MHSLPQRPCFNLRAAPLKTELAVNKAAHSVQVSTVCNRRHRTFSKRLSTSRQIDLYEEGIRSGLFGFEEDQSRNLLLEREATLLEKNNESARPPVGEQMQRSPNNPSGHALS
ncbi:hypothetical protein ALC53_05789 [Atta colombica]|uniref:Uncharacterized protein n=1 Tax=Atta colombica TaxID=520822 RepID=A0A195BHT0_9HYME|nr:hypothetical protein ALC53_05789 [Atta colombica]